MQCLDWVLCMRGRPSVSEKRGLPSPALPSGNWAEPPVPEGTAACKVPRLPPASRSTSVIWEGTQGPDAELGAFCALSSTRQDDSTGPFWKSLRTGLSPKEQRAFPAEHLAGARLLSSWAKSSLTRCHHVGFAPFTEDRETVGRIFLKTGRKAFATLSLCPQLSTKWTCSPPGTSFKG